MKNSISNIATRVSLKAQSLKESAKNALNNENGDFYISEGVKVIIAVILGSLLITAMVALFNSQIIPGIQDKITKLFDILSDYNYSSYCRRLRCVKTRRCRYETTAPPRVS